MPGRRSNNFKNDSKHQNWKRTWSWWDELSRRFIRNYYFTRFSRASCFAVLSGPAFVASHFCIIKSCLHGWRDISRRGRVARGEFYSFSFRPPFVPFEGIKASQPSICSYIYRFDKSQQLLRGKRGGCGTHMSGVERILPLLCTKIRVFLFARYRSKDYTRTRLIVDPCHHQGSLLCMKIGKQIWVTRSLCRRMGEDGNREREREHGQFW